MIIEVKYIFPKSAVDSRAKPHQLEYFEAAAIPDKQRIEKKLTDLGLPFEKETISIATSQSYRGAAESMRRSGIRVTKI
jgi:hypothetical protein